VARQSQRNFLRFFGLVDVDETGEGPEVSKDVQLVYIADDIRRTADLEVGGRATEAAVVAENAILSLRVNSPRGVEIQQLSALGSVAPTDVEQILIWGSQVQPTITGVGGVLSTLRTGNLGPQSVLSTGTIATASIPAAAFMQLNNAVFEQFYATGPNVATDGTTVTQFINFAFGLANIATVMALRWRELRLYPS